MVFATRSALHAWLEEQGLAHVARFNLEALAPSVDPSHWKQLRSIGARRRLTDLACTELIARSNEWLSPRPRLISSAIGRMDSGRSLSPTQR